MLDILKKRMRAEDIEPNVSDTHSDIGEEALVALVSVFTHPFWSRIWIVQEVTLAKSLTPQIGTLSIEPEYMRALLASIFRTVKQSLDVVYVDWLYHLSLFGAFDEIIRGVPAAARITRSVGAHRSTSRSHLYEVLILWSGRRCTKPRDMIFGLLGLTKSRIRVDYSTSQTQLFLNVLIEGILDIAGDTQEEKTTEKQQGLQLRFYEACIGAFECPPTHTTMYYIVQYAFERYGVPDRKLLKDTLVLRFESYLIGNWPSFMRPVMLLNLWFSLAAGFMLDKHISLLLPNPAIISQYRYLRAQSLRAVHQYRLKHLRQSSREMVMPDGEACTCRNWNERIERTANFLGGTCLRPKDSEVSERVEHIRQNQAETRLQKTIEIFAELLLVACVVVSGLALTPLLRKAGAGVEDAVFFMSAKLSSLQGLPLPMRSFEVGPLREL